MHQSTGPDGHPMPASFSLLAEPLALASKIRADRGGRRPAGPSASFRSFANKVRRELAPEGPIESILAERAIAAAWRLDIDIDAEGSREFDASEEASSAERSLARMLSLLLDLKDWRGSRGHHAPDVTAPDWRARLDLDASVSEISPVVKGTWITVGHVVSLIVDGWTWKDVLRTHPELTEDDIRACLTYAVEEEGGW